MKERIHYAPKYFANPTHPITIAVVGCGGTGSMLLPRLARLDQALQEYGHPGLMVFAYDNDIVEHHNILKRQNFYENDLAQRKASSLITRINMAFGTQWKAFDKYCDFIPEGNIIISCVDKIDFRKMMNESRHNFKTHYREYLSQYYWLDCGNGKDFGQVVLSTLMEIEQPKSKVFETVGILKSVYDIFGDLEQFNDKKQQGIESCSYVQSNQEQNLFINDEMATKAVILIENLLHSLKLQYHGMVLNQKSLSSKGILI